MCGIAGRVNAARDRAVDAAQLAEALQRMAHRGPDGEGLYFHESAGLGHRRLAIIDRSTGGQPMSNEDRSVWVTYNGEIYNHAALREELEALGHRFATRSDTEVLVHGWEEWGEALPTRLRGMFAFAIWDGRARRLALFRDRLGIKPVYWALAGRDLVFASEIKALFAFADVRRELDPTRLADYFALRYVPGPATLFKGVQRLQPGFGLTFQDGRVDLRSYWDVPVEAGREDGRPRDEIEEAEVLRQEVLEATRLRLMAEVPVGVFLSGGIDSTTIAWAMKQADPSALKSFAVGYEGDSEGELAWARVAADAIGTEHREVTVDAAGFRGSMEALAWHLDEPVSDGACIPLMHLAKRAREEVVVVLSGEGADEVLAGYPIYSKMLAIERLRGLGGASVDRALALATRRRWHPKLDKYLALARLPLERRYLGVGRAFGDDLVTAFFGAKALEALAERNLARWERTAGLDPLHRMLYLDSKVWLPDDLLVKADKMTMAHSIELRVPFLDHELLAFAWGLPASLKLRRGVGKRVLRTAVAGVVPEPILRREKKGFPVPLSRWLRGELYEPCRARLMASGSAVRAVFGARNLERLLAEHRRGAVDRREELFALWVFEEWHDAFLGRGAQRRERRGGFEPRRHLPATAAAAAGAVT